MRRVKLIPVYYQGQWSGEGSEPDHYVDRQEMMRGLRTCPREYMSINNRTALLKLSTCLPKYPEHKDSIKAGWQGVALNTHSFKFRRDYGALQHRLGPRVLQLVQAVTRPKHSRTRITPAISYSPTQNRGNNGDPQHGLSPA